MQMAHSRYPEGEPMAKTKDYLDYLNTEVGIAPVSSQEELDCAQSLAEVFTSHGLETQVEEFSVPALGQLGYGAVMVLLFLGVLIAGFGGAATFVGIVLALLASALLLMARSGKDLIAGFGPRAHSQNVVALHEAEGEGASRNRPIVIVSHYDTKRLDLLAKPGISVAQKYLAVAMPYVVCAACLCVIIQLLVFLPEGARRTFWVLGVIASLPMLAWGVCTIASRFLPYAQGAVDNKSSVAAMLGVLEDVAPLGEPASAPEAAEAAEAREQAPVVSDSVVQPAVASEPEMRRVVEEVMGARHGERVLRDLGILPAECEITYIEPEVRMVPVAPVAAPVEPVDAEFDAQATVAMPPLTEDAINTEGVSAEPASKDVTESGDPGATRAFTPLEQAEVEAADAPVEGESAGAVADPGATNPLGMLKRVRIDTGSAAEVLSKVKSQAASKLESVASRLRHLEDGQRTDEGPLIDTEQEGLSTMVAEDATEAAETPREQREEPAAIEDPTWGKSSFEPGAAPAAPAPAPAAGDETQPMPPVASEPAAAEATAEAAEAAAESEDAEATAPLAAASASAAPAVPVTRIDTTSVARRAALFDLPNPEAETPDSLAPVRPFAAQGPTPVRIEPTPAAPQRQGAQSAALASDIQVLTAGSSREYSNKRPAGLFGKKAAEQDDSMSSWLGVEEDFDAKSSGEKIGSWDNFGAGEHRGSHWKGGAARSAETRGVEADDAELRDAVLAMDEDALRAHDIWFVATGGSACGHAGIKHFVDLHKKSLRGAFVINLESVGAGELVALTREGAGNARRADRRLLRSLASIARDLHVNLGQADRAWADTEATPVMRKSMRAVTLMGMGEAELPAWSQTEFDVPENVDAAQVADVNALVSEFIRRA